MCMHGDEECIECGTTFRKWEKGPEGCSYGHCFGNHKGYLCGSCVSHTVKTVCDGNCVTDKPLVSGECVCWDNIKQIRKIIYQDQEVFYVCGACYTGKPSIIVITADVRTFIKDVLVDGEDKYIDMSDIMYEYCNECRPDVSYYYKYIQEKLNMDKDDVDRKIFK